MTNYRQLDYLNVDQPDKSSCGKETLYSVMVYYGVDIEKYEIYNAVGDTSKRGTPIEKMVEILEQNKLRYKRGTMNIEDIVKAIDKNRPVLVVLQAWGDEESSKKDYADVWDFGHYVTAIGYDIKHKTVEGKKVIDHDKSEIIFEDPFSPKRTTRTFTQLDTSWHDRVEENLIDKLFHKYKVYEHYSIIVYGKKPKFSREDTTHMD
jgi:hypothetical protein